MISVSVIIPVYQSCMTISEAIESVLSQTYPVTEIIVVDDGSTDDLDAVLKPYLSRIRFIRQKNAGAAAARNNGVRHASGEIIAFLDADDIWLPEKLALQLPLFKATQIAVVYGNVYFLHQGKYQKTTYFDLFRPQKGRIFSSLFAQNCVPILSALVRKNVLDEIGAFDEEIRFVEDYDLWLRIAQKHQFDYISVPVAMYRISSNQISKNFTKAAEYLLRMKEKMYLSTKASFEDNKEDVLIRGLFNKYLKLALCYMRDGRIDDARALVERYREIYKPTYAYFLFRFALWLPQPVIRLLVRLWDRFHQKPELGYY